MTLPDCGVVGGGFGSGSFGSMPWGSGTSSALRVLGAKAITANQVLVVFSGSLGLLQPFLPGDPSNPKSWTLELLDPATGAIRLAQVVEITPQGLVISFDGILTQGATYRITFNNTATTITGCDSAVFVALIIHQTAFQRDGRDDDGFLVDIANPTLARDTSGRGEQAVGTFQQTDTGDIALDSGPASLRKRLFRRASAVVGQFVLMGDYGGNIEVGKLLKPGVAERLQSRIRAQSMREPEVTSARVRLGRVAGNPEVLSVAIKAFTQSGEIDVVAAINLP